MDILFLLVPLSLVIALAIGAVLWVAVDTGQFEDLDGPALNVVADDDRPDAGIDLDQVRRDRSGQTEVGK